MAEYIEREELLKDIEEERPENWTDSESERQAENDFYKYRDIVKMQIAADVVEVVRCKECSHCIVNETHPDKPLICCRTKMCGTTKPEWFCADGEKKEGVEDV